MISRSRILIIRFSSLGDIILLTPLFREVKRCFPNAEIDFLTSTTFAGVCANNPHISKTIAIDRKNSQSELEHFIRHHNPADYDLVIDAHHSIRSRLFLLKWLGLFYRFRHKITVIDKRSFKRNLLLTTGINLMKNAVSQRNAYLNLIAPLVGSESLSAKTELFPSSDDKQRAKKIIQKHRLDGKRLVAVGPGASFAGKCWPKESYLALTDTLEQAGYPVILLGAKGESEQQWIVEHSSIPPLNLAGQLSYLETAALLEHCALVVANDSAVVHFAEAMNVPALAIFGPTVREFGYGPFLEKSKTMQVELSCRPCSRNGKGKCTNPIERQCLRDITVDAILKAALQIVAFSGKNTLSGTGEHIPSNAPKKDDD